MIFFADSRTPCVPICGERCNGSHISNDLLHHYNERFNLIKASVKPTLLAIKLEVGLQHESVLDGRGHKNLKHTQWKQPVKASDQTRRNRISDNNSPSSYSFSFTPLVVVCLSVCPCWSWHITELWANTTNTANHQWKWNIRLSRWCEPGKPVVQQVLTQLLQWKTSCVALVPTEWLDKGPSHQMAWGFENHWPKPLQLV